jgi:hypothetical protein
MAVEEVVAQHQGGRRNRQDVGGYPVGLGQTIRTWPMGVLNWYAATTAIPAGAHRLAGSRVW